MIWRSLRFPRSDFLNGIRMTWLSQSETKAVHMGGGSEVLIVYDESDGCDDDERDIQQDHQ